MGGKAYFIQYRFLLPKTVSHASYAYQKLFRAIYGYTQVVNKAGGKRYVYHRPGVLSRYLYLRAGKNCVVIEPSALPPLLKFFRSGDNPAHRWRRKGNWKAVYYMNEKDLPEKDAARAVDAFLKRLALHDEGLAQALVSEQPASLAPFTRHALKNLFSSPWFSTACAARPSLTVLKTRTLALQKEGSS